jgi:hypothetical protein
LLGAAKDGVLDRQQIGGSWRQASARLKAFALSASESSDPNAVDPAIANELLARYTMDDERRIHAEFFGECHNILGPAPKAAEAEGLEDMFL